MYLDRRSKRLVLDDDLFLNYISIDGYDFEVRYLDPDDPKKSTSPNGSVFSLYDSQQEVITQVIKFCRYFTPCNVPRINIHIERFEREVRALQKAFEAGKNNHVIELIAKGETIINGKTFRYYTMEHADDDLASFLRDNELLPQQRYVLCADMIKCIQSLHAIGIYHRDIKPANFLMIGNNWKIADLGLIDSREEDLAANDWERELIGPRGFLSPEAVNKWLGLKELPPRIDDKSDVFQLAKVMGFVLQGEIFTGQVAPADFLQADESGGLFEVMSRAFEYCKDRRYDIGELRDAFYQRFKEQYALA